MTEVFVAEGTLKLRDQFTPEIDRLLKGMFSVEESINKMQLKFDKLGIGPAVTKIKSQWAEIDRLSKRGVDKVILTSKALEDIGLGGALGKMRAEWQEADTLAKGGVGKIVATMSEVGTAAPGAFGGIVTGADEAFGMVLTSAQRLQSEVIAEFTELGTGAGRAITGGLETAAATMFSPITAAAAEASTVAISSLEKINEAVRVSSASIAGIGATERAVLTRAGGLSSGPHSSSHGGFHFRPHGMSVPGGHLGASQGGDGIVPLVGGLAIGELVKEGIAKGFEMQHWTSQFQAAGFTEAEISRSQGEAWRNAGLNPNASATDSMRMILELNKATGHLDASIAALPQFSVAESTMQSVKAEDLHSHFNGGGQILNFAKALEEMGATQKGDTPEERERSMKTYAAEALRTMIASRGLTDGNSLFAMTNNSGGASQNWDLRMATTVAPLLGDIMKHSKLGNADYMANKSYAGGSITSKAVEHLIQYGLVDDDLKSGKVYEDKGGWHLDGNSKFAEGMSENIWEWSRGVLDKLQAHGIDIHDQKAVNEVVNGIGSNKSTTMMMRALFEPNTRAQMVKEMTLRDRVPDNAASILQDRDPVLKLDAIHKKWDDFLAAPGGPLVDPAIATLTKITSVLNTLAQAMHDHPELTKMGGMALGAGGVGLLGYGGGKMLGLWGGGDAGLGHAATQLDASALALREAAMALGGGRGGALLPSEGKPGSVVTPSGSKLSLPIQSFLYEEGRSALRGIEDNVLGFSSQDHAKADAINPGADLIGILRGWWSGHETGGPVIHSDDDRATRARTSDADAWIQQQDIMKAASQQFGALKNQTGFVLTSFDTLKDTGGGLNTRFETMTMEAGGLGNSFKILEATAIGAARTLAELAMSGGAGGGAGGSGSGFTNASFEPGGVGAGPGAWGGGGAVGGGFGGAGWEKSGATRPEVAAYIQRAAALQGIDPSIALRVSQSEGLNRYTGDYGTSFGPYQLHFGGSGIPGMNVGGLGDVFRRETGLDARDPRTWKAQVDFALRHAKHEGWGVWHGWHGPSRAGMDYHGPVPTDRAAPTVSGPPPRKVTPGVPGSGPVTTAMNIPPIHAHIYVGGKKVHQEIVKGLAAAARFPTDMGGPNARGHYTSPGTPVTDAA